ncbi:unnamed protein product [Phaeothamnion confervicola]
MVLARPSSWGTTSSHRTFLWRPSSIRVATLGTPAGTWGLKSSCATLTALTRVTLWALGLSGTTTGRCTVKNAPLRELIAKAAALVGVFSHSVRQRCPAPHPRPAAGRAALSGTRRHPS